MNKEFIKIGYISKPHGFKGDLRCALEVLILNDDFPKFIWIFIDGKPVPFFVEKFFEKKQQFLLKIEDIEDEETAMQFKNTSIFCEEEVFNTYFEYEETLDDLIGFEVEDSKKGKIGKITSIIENSIQPTLILLHENIEILIPYSSEIIIEIDENNQLIKIEAPEGLIDMYLEEN